MPVFSSGLEEKTTFAKDDMLLIGDSEANDTTRKIKVGTLLAGAGGGGTAPSFEGFPVVRVDSATEISLAPNTRTIIDQPIETLNISFGGSSTSIVEEYSLVFIASEGTQLIFANEIQWANETAPTFVSGKTYEINVIDNLALFISY